MNKLIPRSSRLYRRLRLLRNARNRLLHRAPTIHPTAYVHATAQVARDLVTDEYAFVGRGCEIPPGTSIGRYSMLAPGVRIVGGDHRHDDPTVPVQFSGRPPQVRTTIGRDAWIGSGAFIMHGCSIGDGAIIGAGAVVTHDVPPREIWAGVPARRLRPRFATATAEERHRVMLEGPLQAPSFVAPKEQV